MINVTKSNLHWNYFLALESDLALASRYIEFCTANLDTFSIELAHLLLAAASEVDVLAKCVCEKLAPGSDPKNIYEYQETIVHRIGGISAMQIFVPRYGLDFIPWDNWATPKTPPYWWNSYNRVKHERNEHFNLATLKNVLNALGALLILNYHHQRLTLMEVNPLTQSWDVTPSLRPDSTLLRLPGECYGPLGDNLRR